VNRLLWVIQVVLALLFLFAGGAKLVMSAADLTAQTPLPAAFLRFIGVMEILGGLGLVLLGLLRIQVKLTPLAAAGLVIIMVGAVALTIPMGVAMAALPFVTGVLAAFVAYARWRVAPLPANIGHKPA
jgi:DoxX-like family